MRLCAIPIALCLLSAGTPAYASDWPMYLSDLSHTSFRADETQISPANVGQLQQLWNTSVGATVASGVTVSGGFLYFGDWSGNFHSLNAATGAIVWSQFLGVAPNPPDPSCQPQGIGPSAQPVVSGNTVYAGGGDSAVYAMDNGTGAIQWRVALADPASGSYLWSSLMLYRNALYIGIASLTDCPLVPGGLARIPLDNPTQYQIVYFTPANTLGAGLWSTPAIDSQNNLVYVTTGNGASQDAQQGVWGSALLALDATTLAVQSYFFLPYLASDDDADWGSSPLLFESGGQPLVAANGKTGVMYVLHRPDLALVWSYTLARDCDSPTLGCGSISTPAFDGSVLVTGAGQPDGEGPPGTVYAFNAAGQNQLWRYAADSAVLAPVTLTPGLVFVGSSNSLTVLDESTGGPLWSDGGVGGGLYGQPVVSNGILYAAYVSGTVIAWALNGASGVGGITGLNASPSALQFFDTAGGPAPSTQTIAISAAAPSVSFLVTTDSPWLTTNVASATAPASIAVQADPSGMSPGVYHGNLTIATAGASPIPIAATLVVNPALPRVTPGGIVNAASYQPSVAPGSLFTIFAGGLSADTGAAAGPPWPTSWDGIAVQINGMAVPLAYVSPTQINAQVPYEIAPGAAELTIVSNGTTTPPASLRIQAASPGIFADATGRAAAVNQDGTLNQPGNPAPAGSVISIYLTGQGLVNPPVGTGAAAPGNLSTTAADTTATVGGLPAAVSFSGLAPGFVGLGQVNLLIPNLPGGDQPVIVMIGGAASNTAIVTVAN